MRAILIALAALLGVSVGSAQELLSPRAFRDSVIAQVRTLAPTAEIEIRDDRTFEIRRRGIVNIDNAYTAYIAAPERGAELVARWARIAVAPLENPERSRIVTILRPRDLLDQWRQVQQEHPEASPLLWREFAGDLIVVLALDSEETIAYATDGMISDLGVTIDESWELAQINLPARIGRLTREPASRLVVVSGGAGLAPSDLLRRDFCASQETAGAVYLVLDRGAYLLGNRSSPRELGEFREAMIDVRRAGGPFSATPLECRDGRIAEADLTEQ